MKSLHSSKKSDHRYENWSVQSDFNSRLSCLSVVSTKLTASVLSLHFHRADMRASSSHLTPGKKVNKRIYQNVNLFPLCYESPLHSWAFCYRLQFKTTLGTLCLQIPFVSYSQSHKALCFFCTQESRHNIREVTYKLIVCRPVSGRKNNWPPLPENFPVGPCFYHDITVDIPVEFQKTVKIMYYLWMCE